MKRTLTLRSESLAELTSDELTAVVGGVLPTLPLPQCIAENTDTLQATRCFCP